MSLPTLTSLTSTTSSSLPHRSSPTLNWGRQVDPIPISIYDSTTSSTPITSLTTDNAGETITPNKAITSDPSSTGTDDGGDGDGGMNVGIIVPVVVVVVGLVVTVFILIFRTRLVEFFRRRNSPSSSDPSDQPRDTSTTNSASASARNLNLSRTVTANELSGAPPRGGDSRAQAQGQRARGRGRGRGVRRTESGRSIRTLPKYSKEAGDEELVLVRQRSQSTFSEGSFSDDPDQGTEGNEANEETLLPTPAPGDDTPRGPTPLLANPNAEGVTERLLSDSIVINITDDISPSSTPVPQTAPLPGGTSHPLSSGLGSIVRRGWGEAPTYLEAMSSPSLPLTNTGSSEQIDLEAGVPPPRSQGQTIRTRTSSTFRDFLNRTGFVPLSLSRGNAPPSSTRLTQMGEHRRATSSTSLLLQPQSSRRSSTTSPYGYASPSHSTHSLSLMISSPVPHTAMRASFDSSTLPKAGLSEQQMRFLGSSEAVNLAGIKLEDVPDYRKRRRRSEAPSFDGRSMVGPGASGRVGDGDEGQGSQAEGLPPSWDQLEEERRRNEAWSRRNLGKPVQMSQEQESSDIQAVSSGEGTGISKDVGGAVMDIGAAGSTSQGTDGQMGENEGHSEYGDRDRRTFDLPLPSGPVLEVEPPTPVREESRSRVPSISIRPR